MLKFTEKGISINVKLTLKRVILKLTTLHQQDRKFGRQLRDALNDPALARFGFPRDVSRALGRPRARIGHHQFALSLRCDRSSATSNRNWASVLTEQRPHQQAMTNERRIKVTVGLEFELRVGSESGLRARVRNPNEKNLDRKCSEIEIDIERETKIIIENCIEFNSGTRITIKTGIRIRSRAGSRLEVKKGPRSKPILEPENCKKNRTVFRSDNEIERYESARAAAAAAAADPECKFSSGAPADDEAFLTYMEQFTSFPRILLSVIAKLRNIQTKGIFALCEKEALPCLRKTYASSAASRVTINCAYQAVEIYHMGTYERKSSTIGAEPAPPPLRAQYAAVKSAKRGESSRGLLLG
ncbi:hypothetical protein EVAR_666_1 [Eumeta japonica]|uniref:Uncharacterized protein n=1 Tax=Eumeta variegata TaxID=151549 RepID=A0A4C1SEE9_EUMVA|nr:hypothetical protein EVAR_666_1 [Eumeta japonica]